MDNYRELIGDIDAQHAKLSEMLETLQGTDSDLVDSEEVSDALTAMIDYTHLHFDYEENVMRSLGYAKAAEHAQQHFEFLKNASMFCVDVINGTRGTKKELCNYLSGWIEQHLEEADAELALFIRKKLSSLSP